MWHLTKIPKIVHFYWGNSRLPFLRYLTIYSFCKFNPDWEVNLYLPPKKYKGILRNTSKRYKFTGEDYFPDLELLPINIKTMDINFIKEKTKGLELEYKNISEVYKAGFLRQHLLSTIGGLWSDMDVMYFKSMEELATNKPENKDIDTIISIHPKYNHSVGFLLSSANNEYYKYTLEQSKIKFAPKHYQSIGVDLINKLCRKPQDINARFPSLKIANMPIKTVYAYDATMISTIYNTSDMGRYSKDSIGLHWYGGHHLTAKYLTEVSPETYKNYDNILCKTIAKVYE